MMFNADTGVVFKTIGYELCSQRYDRWYHVVVSSSGIMMQYSCNKVVGGGGGGGVVVKDLRPSSFFILIIYLDLALARTSHLEHTVKVQESA